MRRSLWFLLQLWAIVLIGCKKESGQEASQTPSSPGANAPIGSAANNPAAAIEWVTLAAANADKIPYRKADFLLQLADVQAAIGDKAGAQKSLGNASAAINPNEMASSFGYTGKVVLHASIAERLFRLGDTGNAKANMDYARASISTDALDRGNDIARIAAAEIVGGDEKAAQQTLGALKDSKPSVELANGHAALAFVRFGDIENAKKCLPRTGHPSGLQEAEYGGDRIRIALAAACAERGLFADAETIVGGIESNAVRLRGLANLADQYLAKANTDAARRCFRSAQEIVAGATAPSTESDGIVAGLAAKLGEKETAQAIIEQTKQRVTGISDGSRDYQLLQLVNACLALGDVPSARAAVIQLTDLSNRDQGWVAVAKYSAKSGDLPGAKAAVGQVRPASPRSEAIALIAVGQARAGDLAGAKQTLEESQLPPDPKALAAVGRAAITKGVNADAIKAWAKTFDPRMYGDHVSWIYLGAAQGHAKNHLDSDLER
jgi:Ni,Fe-hydrogenase III small subunit